MSPRSDSSCGCLSQVSIDIQPFYWELQMKDIKLNGVPQVLAFPSLFLILLAAQNMCGPDFCKVVVDTGQNTEQSMGLLTSLCVGTSLLTGPSEKITTLLDTIAVDDNCADFSTLPTLTCKLQLAGGV